MIAKKNRKVDLERKRFAFFQIGLLVSGSLCLAAFEYTSADAAKKQVFVKAEDPLTLGVDVFYDLPEEQTQQKAATVQQEVIDDVKIVDKKQTDGIIVKYTDKIKFDDGDDDDDNDGWKLIPEDEIIDVPAVDPEFIGGAEAMNKWLVSHIDYPEFCAQNGIGGTTYVQFVVNTDGSICMVKEVSSEEADVNEDLKAEAVRVVKMMPKWKPGENGGKKVRVRYTIPIRFIAP